MRQAAALVLALLLIGHSTASWAASEAEESTLSQIGAGVGSTIGTVIYFPFKAAFCIVGGVTSGFTVIFAGPENAGKVARTACRGTWVITPDVVKGKESVKFAGDPSPSEKAPTAK
ncbi:MAG: hypothetical protein KGL32_07750 [candidate division NC10 bacterium]|nr:hypothetical protein [candidate division NC10 bacterium]